MKMEDVSLLSDQDDFEPVQAQGVCQSVKQNISKKQNRLLHLASFVAAIGGVLFGYDIGIISGALLQLRVHFQLSCSKQELIVTSLIIGGLIASLIGGHIIDQFGRRKAIILNSVFFIFGAIILATARSFSILIAGRLILGFAVSLSAIAECIYISEIAPSAKRGLLVSLNELGITIGILLAYFVNFLFINVEHGWRIMFALSSLPALVQGLAMSFLPSSPRWLLAQKRNGEAAKVISALWPQCDTEHQIQKINNSLNDEKDYSLTDLVSKKENLRMRMIIGCGIVFFQQITGQPTVLYYAPAIFQSLGFVSGSAATLATVGLGIVKVIFTSITILIVDRVGRRVLLLVGVTTMTVSVIILAAVTQPIHNLQSKHPCDNNYISAGHTFISQPSYNFIKHCHDLHNTSKSINHSLYSNDNGIYSNILVKDSEHSDDDNNTVFKNCTLRYRHIKAQVVQQYAQSMKYISLVALMTFVAGYAIGYGPISWLILTEIFPIGVKGRAVGIATAFNWGTNILICMTFLEIIGSLGPSMTFFVYSILGTIAIAFIYNFVPETKCRSLEQISDEMSKRSGFCLSKSSFWNCFSSSQQLPVSLEDENNQQPLLNENNQQTDTRL